MLIVFLNSYILSCIMSITKVHYNTNKSKLIVFLVVLYAFIVFILTATLSALGILSFDYGVNCIENKTLKRR